MPSYRTQKIAETNDQDRDRYIECIRPREALPNELPIEISAKEPQQKCGEEKKEYEFQVFTQVRLNRGPVFFEHKSKKILYSIGKS